MQQRKQVFKSKGTERHLRTSCCLWSSATWEIMSVRVQGLSHSPAFLQSPVRVQGLSHSPAFLQSSSHVWHFLLDPMSSVTNVRLVPRIIEKSPYQGQPMPLWDCFGHITPSLSNGLLGYQAPFVQREEYVIFFLNKIVGWRHLQREGMTRRGLRASHFLS